ncbi:hypothetical protein, partial [Nocardia mexicana]|uniref:hypothetical protein n=1 Tax=Nocardia mexicana TaxID=279262 RepID=UPI001FE89180
MPPTAAAIKPAAIGAPEAIAIPSDNGRATRNTTIDAGRSWRVIDENLADHEPPGGESDLDVVSVSVDIFLLHQAGGPVRSVEHVLQASKAA